MSNELNTVDALSELGEWSDVKGYPNYRISSNGAVMNKRALKILKHFRYATTQEPSVTLYRKGHGEILSVDQLVLDTFFFEGDPLLPRESLGKSLSLRKKRSKPNQICV